jgi:protein SCO1/2
VQARATLGRVAAHVCLAVAALAVAHGAAAALQRTYAVTGMVLRVEPSGTRFLVSHEEVPGLMPAMSMSFDVLDPAELSAVLPGMRVAFALPVSKGSAYAERVRILRGAAGESLERPHGQPAAAARQPEAAPNPIGRPAPEFALADQTGRRLTAAQLRGTVVALSFVDAECAAPSPCFRVSEIMSDLHARFEGQMGTRLVLLSVALDPDRDGGAVTRYARAWAAGRAGWHVLTGAAADLERLRSRYRVPAAGDRPGPSRVMRTAIVDRDGIVAAIVEGHEHTARQLGDLIDVVLGR